MPPFFIKCPVPSQENGHCYIIGCFCVCYISVLCRSSLIFDTFPSVLVCNPDLFFLYRFMDGLLCSPSRTSFGLLIIF